MAEIKIQSVEPLLMRKADAIAMLGGSPLIFDCLVEQCGLQPAVERERILLYETSKIKVALEIALANGHLAKFRRH